MAKEPFLSWLKALPDSADLTPEEMNGDATVYLLPVCDDDRAQDRVLARCFHLIFEEQLSAWWTDESAWPQGRNLKLFKRWFDVEFHSIVLDLVNGPLLDDEWEDAPAI